MRLFLFTLAFSSLILGCSPTSQESEAQEIKQSETEVALSYPEPARGEVIDNYFGTAVADPYRWLEDDRNADTKDWVERQNAVTFSYLDKIPYRDQIKNQLLKIWNYEKKLHLLL